MTELKVQRYHRFEAARGACINTDWAYIPEMDTTIEINYAGFAERCGVRDVTIKMGNHLDLEAVKRLSSGDISWTDWTEYDSPALFSGYREFSVEKRNIDSLLMGCALREGLMMEYAKLEEKRVKMTKAIKGDLATFL